jgi:hypothetical protein
VCLQRRLQRRIRDASGVVRDGRGGDDGDHLKQKILAKAGRNETFNVLIVKPSALFDHRPRRRRESTELGIRRRTAGAHRRDIRGSNAGLKRESGMERDRPEGAGIGHSVGVQNRLNLRLGKAPAVNLVEYADKALDEHTGDVAMAPARLRIVPNLVCTSRSADLEASRAESNVWTGKRSMSLLVV